MKSHRIIALREGVNTIYLAQNPDRALWADYLFEGHIYLVAEQSILLAERFGGNAELVYAGSILHDIADAVMSRFDPNHSAESLRIARNFLTTAGFSDKEIIIIDDILLNHSCRDILPQTQEGKIMATADAVVHLTSDFYPYALRAMQNSGESLESIQAWAFPKIERDFYTKIFFDEVREEIRPDYYRAKEIFQVQPK